MVPGSDKNARLVSGRGEAENTLLLFFCVVALLHLLLGGEKPEAGECSL